MFKKILMIFILQQAFIIYFDGIIRFKVDDENKFEPLCQLLNSNNIQLQKVAVNNAIKYSSTSNHAYIDIEIQKISHNFKRKHLADCIHIRNIL